jgi:hypothetical protein
MEESGWIFGMAEPVGRFYLLGTITKFASAFGGSFVTHEVSSCFSSRRQSTVGFETDSGWAACCLEGTTKRVRQTSKVVDN